MIFTLTSEQWSLVAPILTLKRLDGRGRPRKPDRNVLQSILYVIQMGGSWRRLPKDGPSFQTCHRRCHEWIDSGKLDRVFEALAQDMENRTGITMKFCFQDELYRLILENAIIMNEGLGLSPYEDPDLPWETRIRLFFSSRWVWKMLLNTRSEWLRSRLPIDLAQRSECVEFDPSF